MEPFFKERVEQGYTIVDFTTESLMNPLELESIGHALYQLVDTTKPQKLLLDFQRVKYLSSQAVGIILTLNKKISQTKVTITLCGVGPALLQLLKITRLDKILTLKPSIGDVIRPV